jgi:hypothetical protein
MKNFILFSVIFLASAYLFGSEEISANLKESAISESPAFASAKFVEVVKTGGKKLSSYRVRYAFQVGGTQYYALTTSTDEQGALQYAAQPETLVAYDSRNPTVNALKRYYDQRRNRGNLSQSLVVVGVLSVLIALPVWLLLSWKFGWLKRKRPAA